MSDLPPAPEAMSEADEADLTRLADQAALALRLGRQSEAVVAAAELLKRWPESTTAHELAGDVALAEGQLSRARQLYRRALELEPANADAERKYASSLLAQTPDERRAALIQQVIADPTASRSGTRRPLNAVLNAMLFPGVGQLYNHEQEKGLTIVAGAAVAVIVLLSVIMPYVSATFTLGSPNARETQRRAAQAVVDGIGAWQWTLVIICGAVFLALYLWGIYDAWRHAQSEADQALGVR